MLNFHINVAGLMLKVASITAKAALFGNALARSVNSVGQQTVDDMAGHLNRQIGISKENARKMLLVKTAQAGRRVEFTINTARSLMGTTISRAAPTQRQFLRRPNAHFRSGELVYIVTMEDDAVCPICQELGENSPYTIEEARALIPAHFRCRCTVRAFRTRGRLTAELAQQAAISFGVRTTVAKLVSAVQGNINSILRAR